MGRNSAAKSKGSGPFRRAAEAVKSLFSRGDGEVEVMESSAAAVPARQASTETHGARPVKREADIPLAQLEQDYTPALTSSKASFRSDGEDHARDQEFAAVSASDRFLDEDHLTNRSGDPRIGTHGRKYEPDENRAGSRQ